MDELKLETWRNRFNEEAIKFLSSASLQNEENSNRFYELSLDESDELVIKTNDELPVYIKEKLQQILIETKPEESV